MGSFIFEDKDGKETAIQFKPYKHITVIDNEGNYYNIKPDKFGGLEIISIDGSIEIDPCVSNHIVIKTRK